MEDKSSEASVVLETTPATGGSCGVFVMVAGVGGYVDGSWTSWTASGDDLALAFATGIMLSPKSTTGSCGVINNDLIM